MEKVNIIIKGLHSDGTDNANMSINAEGNYYYKNDKHYICYEETDKESGETTNSVMKIWDNHVELVKRGIGGMHLHFEDGKLNRTYLQTIMGKMLIGVDTRYINVIEEDDRIQANIEYGLIVEDEKVSDCSIEILIQDIK